MHFKRVFDIVFCITIGLVLLPFLAVFSLLIRLDSPGPIIFTQTRLGQHKKPFKIFKFRTMYINAEDRLHTILHENNYLKQQWIQHQKIIPDPRITRVGGWLRKTSLDELPQLLNVLLGDMTLVGPRPIVAVEVPRYGRDYATYSQVKPGLTGLWQVSGRTQTTYAQRVTLDVTYVYNWSIYTDIWILCRTILEVLRCTGC